MNLDDLYALLLSHKMKLEQKKGKLSTEIVDNLISNFVQKNQGLSKLGFGNQKGNRNIDSFNRDLSNLGPTNSNS